MSINCCIISPNGTSPVPLPQEKFFFQQHSVKVVLDCNENGYPGNSGGYWQGTGHVTLTNQRIVFVANPPSAEFLSLAIPITHFKGWKLEQPWFGANYVAGIVVPVIGGGLSKGGTATITFKEGGAIEFTTILQGLMERMAETNEMPQHFEPLPAYEAASASQPQASTAATQPYNDLPPSYDDLH
ncbi:uncharacterized protein BYT42DRAFT_555271 [Radiomyces spectabilis]|uniref:uncharacterized protein n=1 Tax=Radiomyces spectabilis TaxID=64574 RepID=UPI00221FE2FD|nr:uncharacterized protein BYT42DRAFT_555271 [Radiomyces spectabilis]KAI8391016.1 hypothetical protein BYT42DRAFT_555271 [Radiomyces spectabilis]